LLRISADPADPPDFIIIVSSIRLSKPVLARYMFSQVHMAGTTVPGNSSGTRGLSQIKYDLRLVLKFCRRCSVASGVT